MDSRRPVNSDVRPLVIEAFQYEVLRTNLGSRGVIALYCPRANAVC